MAQDELDSFIDSLIERKQLKGLTPEGREDIKNELKEMLVKEINTAIIDALPEDKLNELDELTSHDDYKPEDAQKIIDESGVNVAKITTETLLYFETFYLGQSEA